MKITALEEYGLRCLVRIAEHDGDEPISAREIAESEGLSLPYTQKILRELSEGGIVAAQRGAHGGYYLEHSVDEISLGDVMRQLGGMVELDEFCDEHTGQRDSCVHVCDCSIRPVWARISAFVAKTMDNVPLSILTEDEEEVEHYLDELSSPLESEDEEAWTAPPMSHQTG
jgi:Rrf2 family protein